jgi:ribonuclease HI
MAHPGSLWPRPAKCSDDGEGCHFVEVGALGCAAAVPEPALWALSGKVYPDGSCLPHVLSELSRAAWAAVMVDCNGKELKAVYGVVPSYIRQTAYAAEWCATAVVAQLADDVCDAAQDCKGVVQEWSKPPVRQLRPDSMHAGQARELRRYPSRERVALRWIKGHVLDKVDNPRAIADPDERCDALGNAAADRRANDARDLHPRPSKGLADKVTQDIKDVEAVLAYAAKVLILWPKIDRDELRAAERTAGRRRPSNLGSHHRWMSVGRAWQCARCMSTALSDASAARRRRERCPGRAVRLRRVLAEPQGHQLAVADVDGGPCVLCVACGAWCRLRPRKLSESCKGKAGREAAGSVALARFKQGFLPSDGRDGAALQRRVHGVRPLSAQAVAHWDSWREPARLAASVEPEPPAPTRTGKVAVTVPPLERYRLLPSWRASGPDSTETTQARRKLVASLAAAVREGEAMHA